MSAGQEETVTRMVAALVTSAIGAAAPPGIGRAAFAKALVEDSCDLVAGLERVSAAVAVGAAAEKDLGGLGVAELAWPGTKVLPLAPDGHDGPVVQTLGELAALGAHQAAVLAADAPDLPLLLIGKLFRALGGGLRRADVAVCPADGGGLVALACWLPLADWAARALAAKPSDAAVELDRGDITDRLRHAAPRPGAVQIVPGWHRLRSPVDTYHLDPGLEGWAATRRLLAAGH